MASGKYTEKVKDENEREYTEIKEDGHITPENVNLFKFSFTPGEDITSSLDKANERSSRISKPRDSAGRVGMSYLTCKYPNGEESSKIAIRKCILQYRENMGGSANAQDYGVTYVTIGVPKVVVDKILSDAKQSNVNLVLKDKQRFKNNYYWFDTDITKLGIVDTTILVDVPGSDKTSIVNMSIRDMLLDTKKGVQSTATLSFNGSMSTKSRVENLPLTTGVYHPSVKIAHIVMETDTDIEGPLFSEIAKQSKIEKAEYSSESVSTGSVMAAALKRLGINT